MSPERFRDVRETGRWFTLLRTIVTSLKWNTYGGRTQFQQCCVKAGAAFKKQNKQLNAYWLIYTLFSNEANLRNPRSTDRGAQLNAAHAQLLQKLRSIAFAQTCRFRTIQSLEFQEIWPKNSLKTTWMIYHEKSEFLLREFLILQKTIYGELRKSPKSTFY